ncbi:MAG TPA: glycosyltransferase [Vicinamibacterales bacterium]
MSRPGIACFSNLDYGLLRYRKQHLMDRLASRLPVLYVNPPRAIKSRDLLTAVRWRQPIEGLTVFEPPVLPGVRTRPRLQRLNYRLIASRLAGWCARHDPFVLWIYSPHALPFVDLLRPDLVVYDVADLYATPGGPSLRDRNEAREVARLAELEAALLHRADLVLAVSEPLVERLGEQGVRAHLVPNGSDWTRYATYVPPPRQGRPRLGFVGAIAPRVNVDLIAEVARRRPGWDIVLVGPVSTAVDALAELPNVRLTGEVPYDAVPGVISAFDVCLLPLHEIPFAYCSSPIQVYDYLAAGRPVVSTPVAQLERLPEVVRTARGANAFVEAIEQALDEEAGAADARRAFARANSWDARVETILALLQERLPALAAAA